MAEAQMQAKIDRAHEILAAHEDRLKALEQRLGPGPKKRGRPRKYDRDAISKAIENALFNINPGASQKFIADRIADEVLEVLP